MFYQNNILFFKEKNKTHKLLVSGKYLIMINNFSYDISDLINDFQRISILGLETDNQL